MAQDQLLAILESFRGPADGGTSSDCDAGPIDHAAWAADRHSPARRQAVTRALREARQVGTTLPPEVMD